MQRPIAGELCPYPVRGHNLDTREPAHALGMVQCQPKGGACPAVMPDEAEFAEPELFHDLHLILRHASEGVVAVVGEARRFRAIPIAAQIAGYHGEVLCQPWRDLVPGHMRQRVPMQEQEPRAGATIT